MRFNSIPQQAVGQSYPPRLPDHIISQYRSFVNYFPNICSVLLFYRVHFKEKDFIFGFSYGII
nr:MAG TPA: hypothetical protein [Caudoviricetes sp.]